MRAAMSSAMRTWTPRGDEADDLASTNRAHELRTYFGRLPMKVPLAVIV